MSNFAAFNATRFTNLAWDSTLFQPAVICPTDQHWLIQSLEGTKSDSNSPKYLQIANGLWCTSSRATKFPSRHSAMAYAIEFGLVIGHTAKLVRPAESIAA